MLKKYFYFNSSILQRSASIFVAGLLLLFVMPSSAFADVTCAEYTGTTSHFGAGFNFNSEGGNYHAVWKATDANYNNVDCTPTHVTVNIFDKGSATQLRVMVSSHFTNGMYSAPDNLACDTGYQTFTTGIQTFECDVVSAPFVASTSSLTNEVIFGYNNGDLDIVYDSYPSASVAYLILEERDIIPPDTTTRFISTDPTTPFHLSGDAIDGDATVELADTSDIYTNQVFYNACFPSGAFVDTITDGDTFEASEPATGDCTDSAFEFLSTVPQSHTIDIHVYINHDDWVEGMYVDVAFTNQQVEQVGGDALQAWNSAFGGGGDNGFNTIQFEIEESDTDQDLHLTYPIEFESIGASRATFRIIKPNFWSNLWIIGSLFGGSPIVMRDLDFIISEQTVFNKLFHQAVGGNPSPLVSGILTGGISTSLSACEIATFSLSKCLFSLFIPTTGQLAQVWTDIKAKVFTIWPFGYITRVVTIFTNFTPIEPPALTYTFGSAVEGTGLEGETLTYQIYDHFDVLEDIRSDQVGSEDKNIWDIIMPWWKVAVNLALFLAIFSKLMNVGINWDFSQQSSNSSSGNVRFSKEEMNHINNPTVARTESEYNLYKKL